MYNPGEDDNELDRLSREAASGYKLQGRPDWDAMQARLDKELPQQDKKRRFGILWWLVPGILVAGIAYYELTGKPNQSAITTTTPPVGIATAPKENTLPATKTAETANNKPTPGEEVAQISEVAPSTHTATVKDVPARVEQAAVSNAVKTRKSKGHVTDADNSITTVTKPAVNETANVTAEKEVINNPNTIPVKSEDVIASKPVSAEDKAVDNPVPATEKTNTVPPAATDSIVHNEAAVVTTKKVNRNKAWSISVLGEIDESTIKFKYGYEPGYGAGILAGFHFNKVFSLHTGVTYTQKNYKMDGADFTAPKGTPPSYYKLETVEGYCRMWEVPLLARFYTSHSDKKGFFLSTGLSSYFMTSESYSYTYHYMGMPGTKKLEYTSSTNHILSIANFSAGFENRIGNNIYLQIEPYAKLPLGGVGTGKIELSSYGVNIGVQLRKPVKH